MDPKQTTKLGTPISPKWDQEWTAEVENVEHQLNRRICGAHSPAYTPCKLGSNHPNGRCRYHGGHSRIGAPLGNRNAMVHGLYSRRLQQCGDHCTHWQTCPRPNKDIEALPKKERPHCPYEQEEYDRIHAAHATQPRQGATAPCPFPEFDPNLSPTPPRQGAIAPCPRPQIPSLVPETAGDILLHQNIATFHVMLTRAQAALGWHAYTEETRADGEKYTMRSSKVSALLQATQSIARELRQWLRLLANDAVRLVLNLTKAEPEESLGLAALLEPILEKAKPVLDREIEEERRFKADERLLKRGEMTQEAFDTKWPEDEYDRDDDLEPSPGAPLLRPIPG